MYSRRVRTRTGPVWGLQFQAGTTEVRILEAQLGKASISTSDTLNIHPLPSIHHPIRPSRSHPLIHNGWRRLLHHCRQAGRRSLRWSSLNWNPPPQVLRETDLESLPQLAMAWLASLYAGVKYATSGSSSKPSATAAPPINASSSDEADFIKCANSASGPLAVPSANRSAGTSSSSRTRRTKRPEKGRRSCGFADAVYIYQSWRHELFIEPDSRFQIPTKAESAIDGITMSEFPSASLQ